MPDLAPPFAPVALAEWQQAVKRELRGRALETLQDTLPGGLTVKPLYTAADRPAGGDGGLPGEAPYRRGASPVGGWDLCLRHTDPRRGELAAALRADLEGGARGAWLQLDRRLRLSGADGDVGVEGAALYSIDALDAAFAGQDLGRLHLRLDAGARAPYAAAMWCALAARREAPLEQARLRFCLDPAGALARDGALPDDLRRLWADAAGLARRCEAELPAARALLASTEAVHCAGADAPLELAVALGGVVEALEGLEREGLAAERVANQIELSLAMGRDLFLNIARLRAMRVLWSHLLSACGLEPIREQPLPAPDIHAFSSPRTLSRRDPWINILRVTTQVFAAIVGGAQRITPAAYDEALGQPDEAGRRLARNTALVLGLESHLGVVVDPGGGSYYLEALTDELVAAAWARFQQLHEQGGLITAMRSGWLHHELRQCWRAREAALAKRTQPVLGVSEYPDLAADPAALRRFEALSEPERISLLVRGAPVPTPTGEGLEAEPLPRHRDADPFEALQDRAEAAPARPVVYLATLGAPAEWSARADFATNLLAAGGIGVIVDPGGEEADPAIAAAGLAARFAASGARGVCICGTDEAYQTHGPALARTLQATRPAGSGGPVMLAGRPDPALQEAGVTRFLHLGCDALSILSTLLQTWGL